MKIRYGFLSIVFALCLVVYPAGAVDLSLMTKVKEVNKKTAYLSSLFSLIMDKLSTII